MEPSSLNVRAFLGIWMPESIAREMEAWRPRLEPLVRGARWTRTAQLHLTLVFLGEIAPETVDRISPTVAAFVGGYRAPRIALSGFGVFPPRGHGRILWAGVESGGRLEAFARELRLGLERLGFPPEERPWVPHVTLARARAPFPSSLPSELAGLAVGASEVAAECGPVHFVASELRKEGPHYRILRSFGWEAAT